MEGMYSVGYDDINRLSRRCDSLQKEIDLLKLLAKQQLELTDRLTALLEQATGLRK